MWRFYTYVLYRCNTGSECVLVSPPARWATPFQGVGGLAGENVPQGSHGVMGLAPSLGTSLAWPWIGLGLGDWDCIGGVRTFPRWPPTPEGGRASARGEIKSQRH